jgi:cytochrome c oxidase subunit 1
MPLQIGARDVAFPRLNAFSLWTFSSPARSSSTRLVHARRARPPPAGSATRRSPPEAVQCGDISIDIWVMGLQILGVASVAASLNFIVTIINLRAPGHDDDAPAGVHLDDADHVVPHHPRLSRHHHRAGRADDGPPLRHQLLRGLQRRHADPLAAPVLDLRPPEVYILILPAMGIVSEILPTFSRKPLFGYPIVVFSGAIIGFIGFGVWSHHMFTTGMGTSPPRRSRSPPWPSRCRPA